MFRLFSIYEVRRFKELTFFGGLQKFPVLLSGTLVSIEMPLALAAIHIELTAWRVLRITIVCSTDVEMLTHITCSIHGTS